MQSIACADDEYYQRRFPFRFSYCFSGIYDSPGGSENLPGSCSDGSRDFHTLKKVLHDRGLSTAVGDEGGFAPTLKGTEDALESIIEAIKKRVTNQAKR